MRLNLKDITYNVNGLTIACQRLENDNTKIIALHGWQDNSNSFIPLIGEMADFDWYAIDFPGHGHSSWRHHEAHYYFIDYVDDVYRLLEQISPNERVIIVGHSMGAMVANLFAACFPEKVDCVIAIEGLACVTTPEPDVINQLKNAIVNRTKVASRRMFKHFHQVVNARVAVSDLSVESAALIMKRNTTQTDTGVQLLTDPKLKHHSGFRFSPAQCREICQQITAPVLLLKAKNGFEMVSRAIESYNALYHDLHIVDVPGGHHCHIEHAKIIANEIYVYVNGVK